MNASRSLFRFIPISLCTVTLVGVFTVACGSDAPKGAVVAAAASVGTPCVVPNETSPTFSGFSELEFVIGSDARTGGPFCLVNHFRGRTTCPYGQDDTGAPPSGASRCTTSSGSAVTGARDAGQGSAKVAAQCADRRAADTVIWSCRCANVEGKTDDGDTYCACPNAMTCAPLLVGLGVDPNHMGGSYCIKNGTEFKQSSACAVSCDPATQPCQ